MLRPEQRGKKKFSSEVDMGVFFCQYRKVLKFRGYSSVVERHLAKVNVARSNRVTRFESL